MRRILIASAAALALAACSSGSDDADADGDGSVSADEMAAATAKVKPLDPGEYKMSMELVELTDPSMSEQEIGQMREFMTSMGNMAPPRCLTEEEASRGMVGVAEQMQNASCTVTSMRSTESSMNAKMSCEDGTVTTTIDSQSTGTSSSMTMTVEEPGASEGAKRMVMKIDMNRTGDCATT